MRYTLLLFLIMFSLITFSVQGQTSQLSKTQLRDSISCVQAQPQVVAYCKELLSTPMTFSPEHLNIAMYILDWMQHTYNYQFIFDQNFYNIIKIETSLANRYAAALVLVAIEKGYHTNSLELQTQAIGMVLDYCSKKSNEVFISSGLQKYLDAQKAGQLSQWIQLNWNNFF